MPVGQQPRWPNLFRPRFFAVLFLLTLAGLGTNCSLRNAALPAGVTYGSIRSLADPIVHSANEVLGVGPERWRLVPAGTTPSFGFSEQVVWLRFTISNQQSAPFTAAVALMATWIDTIDCYRVDSGRAVLMGERGDRRPFHVGSGSHRYPVFFLEVPPQGQVEVLLRFGSTGAMFIPLEVYSASAFEAGTGPEYALHGLYFGLLLTLAVFCSALFAISRHPMFSWYVLYLCTASLIFGISNGFGHAFIWKSGGYPLNEGLISLGLFAMVFSLSFSREFLGLALAVPRIDRGLIALTLALLGVAVWAAFPGTYAASVRIANLVVPLLLVIIVSLGVLAACLKLVQARLFLLGWTALLVGGVYEIAATVGLAPVSALSPYGSQIGVLVEALVFSVALGDRQRTIMLQRAAKAARLQALEADIQMARGIQEELLRTPPDMARIGIDVVYRPQAAVGGDFYAFEQLSEDELIVFTADVTGHGLGAALDASGVRIAFRNAVLQSKEPREILAEMNRTLIGHLDFRFVAACCVRLNSAAGTGIVSVGAHPAPVLLRKEGATVVPIEGSLIGFRYGNRFTDVSFPFEPGARLLIFTDGLFESASSDQPVEGEAAVLSVAQSHSDRSLGEMGARIMADMERLRGDPSQNDDITLVCVERRGP